MTNTPFIRSRLKALENEIERVKTELRIAENNHDHIWGETERFSKEKTEFRENYNRPVTHGIDRWYEMESYKTYVPAYRRLCTICGKIEETTNTQDQITKVAKF